MFSFFKSQVIKPFLKFTKNLSADQINLSVLKGEGELKSLELDETTLMELLDLPTWLYLRKAHCSGISFKIRWTKLETHPIFVVIDRVDVELEALDEPRPVTDSMFASYRTGSGKYRLPDRVVDGATILVNSVFICFCARAFKASIELSRLTLMSKTPQWQNGALNLTSLMFPAGDAVLIFKEISWDSVRIAADGLLSELNGIPVKLITNTGRIRLTLKKRLSDSALISTRIQLILDDLLWVLTLSQVEAAIVFLRSLKHSVVLAAQQRRQYAESRAERQTLGWQTSMKSASTHITPTKREKMANMDQYSWAARIFHQHDVLETSYHFCVCRTEIHFCDETRESTQLSQIVVPNGYIKVHLHNLELDWYPYHVEPSPQVRWRGSTTFREARDNWLASLNRAHLPQTRPVQMRHPPADPLLNLPMQMPTRFSPFPSTVNLSVIQSVLVLRIRDFDVSRVSFPDTCKSGLKSSGSSAACNALQYRGEELPSATHLFLASDKKLHCLPESSNVITVELRTTYRSRERKFNRVADNLILPCILFAQLQPFYLRFDTDTVIWLNAFLLTLHVNLSAFVQLRSEESVLDTDHEVNNHGQNLPVLHIRCEALMPRIILPIPDTRLSQTGISSVEAIQSGPDALVIQFDQVVIQLLAPPLNQTAASVLKRLLAKHALISVTDEFATDRGRVEARTHVPVNLDRLSDLGASAGCSESIDTENQYWCVHCPHMWAQFLTVVKVLDDFPKKRNALGRTNLSLYRQSMLEPIPLTLWASLRFPFHPVPAVPVQPGFQLLIDLDCPVNPLDTDRRGFASLSNQAEPISLFLGAVPPVNGKLCWLPIGNQRLPDALDQLLFLCNLANQLSRVKDQLGLDMNRISGVLNNATEVPSARTSPLLYTLAFVIQKRLQLHLVSPGGALSHMNRTLRPPVDDLDSSNFCSDQQQSPVPGQLIRTAERLDRDHPESHSSIMERMSPPAKAHMDVPINLKHKNNSFIALVDNNRQTDNFSLKSSSTSDITSVSDDYMDKEAGAQENWLSTYEVLFRTEDALRDSDSTSVSSSGCCSSNHRFDYPKPSPEEVGTELFEMESLRLSQHTSTSDSDPLKSASGRSSRLSQSSFGDRNQREATCCPESPNENPYPLTIMLMLDGVAGEADGTDTKMRMWLKIGLVSLAYKHGTPDCMIHEKTVSELPDFPSTSRVFSWSIFTSVIRQLVNKSPDDPNETDEPSYRTSVCLHADLLKSCSLQIPKVALQTGEQLLRCFNTRGGLDRLQSMLPTGTLLREMQAPLTTMDVSLHLKRGFLAVEMGSLQTSEPGELIRKIHLQQGLSLVLDKNAVLNVGLSENNSRVVHPKKMATDSSEILVDAPYLAGDNNDLLCQYLQENAQLEKNMRQLNSTVDELKTVLASMDHLLSMIPQR